MLKHSILLFVLFMNCIFISCNPLAGVMIDAGNDDVTENETETQNGTENIPLEGKWKIEKAKYVEEGELKDWNEMAMYIEFDENNNYSAHGYFGDCSRTYSFDKKQRKILVDEKNGGVISVFTNVEVTETTFSACLEFTLSCNYVWIECSRQTSSPVEPLSTFALFSDSTQAQQILDNLYSDTATYINMQLEVSKKMGSFRAESKEVLDLWNKGFNIVSNTNSMLGSMGGVIFSGMAREVEDKLNHLRAIRAFVLYNMNLMWGGIPLYTPDMSPEEYSEVGRSTEKEVLEHLIKELNQFEMPVFDWSTKYIIREQTRYALLTECYLAVENYDKALYCANYSEAIDGWQYNFILKYYPYVGADFTGIIIYEWKMIDLYRNEAQRKLTNLESEWDKVFKNRYGYWAAMKRMGYAMDKAQCQGYQLLLPIPFTYVYNYNLTQNPGY